MSQMPAAVCRVEGISEYHLPNGLKVVLYPNYSKPTATVNVTYRVGSRHENYGETGMAHLLEHLMFKGSKNYPNPTAEFTQRGFRMNGSTWLDRTNYHVCFTANDDNMRWALGWQADAMVNSFIAQKDLDTEMTVVRNEFEMGENKPMSVMLKRFQGMLFDWHSYGRPTIGARSDIENVEIENLQAFYRCYYQPDNAVLVVTGNFEPEKVWGWIEETFGQIAKPTRTLPKQWTVEPTADGEREFYVRRKGESQMVMLGYRLPSALDDTYEPVHMAAEILGDEPSGRLYKAIVETGLASDVFAYTFAAEHPGMVIFVATLGKDQPIEPVKQKMIEVVETTFSQTPVTDEELTRHLTSQITEFERVYSDPETFGVEISDYIALGDWRLFFADREIVRQTKADDIAVAAQRYFRRDNRLVGLFVPTDTPQRAEIPTPPTAAEIVERFTFTEEGEVGEAFDISQDHLNEATHLYSEGAFKVALLPKKTSGATVHVAMNFNMGDNTHPMNIMAQNFLEEMFLTGTPTMTREEINDAFTKLKMTGGVFGFVTDKENVVPALELVGHLMTQTTFDEKEFQTLKAQMLDYWRGRSDEPMVLAGDALIKHYAIYAPGDMRYKYTHAERIEALEKLTVDDVKRVYDEFFNLTTGQVSIVGDFDEEAVKVALHAHIVGKKQAPVAFKRAVAEFKPVAARRFVIDTPEKENGVLATYVTLPVALNDDDVAALMVANWILGGSYGLSNRIVNRIRQQEGLSYGAASMLDLQSFGNNTNWFISVIAAPQNLKQAEESLLDILKSAYQDGVTQEELDAAKAGFIDWRMVNRSQDSTLCQSWLLLLERGSDWSDSKALEAKVKALTLDEVNAAVKRLCNVDNISWVLAGDVRKATQAGKAF